MEALAALGVASAAISFYQFAFEALKICKQVRDSVENATEGNKLLEEYGEDIKEALKELESSPQSSSASAKRVNKAAQDCLKTSEELLQMLQDVRGVERNKSSEKAKAFFRALKDRRKIEKLQAQLLEGQRWLDTALIPDMRNRLDQVIRQGCVLEPRMQEVVTRFQNYETETLQRLDKVNLKLSAIQQQSQSTHSTVVTSQARVQKGLEQVGAKVGKGFEGLDMQNRKERLLQSLYFPDLTNRREMIKPPWQDTFDWIYDDRIESLETCWPSFVDWLKHGTSLYWVCGKAGSGKSTLMAHMVNDERTHKNLRVWAGRAELHFLSYYFWRPGSTLEKSIVGLLRSLLYQLVREVRGLATLMLSDPHNPLDRISTWTVSNLSRMLRLALNTRTAKFCLFIDGLDEFEGDYDELLDQIGSLGVSDNVKFCISSRPETQLSRRLSGRSTLRLEDLNYEDIRTFVAGKLQQYEEEPYPIRFYIEEISAHAEGVFLWAALTAQSMSKGIAAGDDESILSKRLRDTPKGMDALFARMLEDADEVHKDSLAYHLRVLMLSHELRGYSRSFSPTITLLAASRHRGDMSLLGNFIRSCESSGNQVVAQSNGLIDVHWIKPYNSKGRNTWSIPQLDFAENTVDPQSRNRLDIIQSRTLTPKDDLVEDFEKHQDTLITWVHRSAYDFMVSSDNHTVAKLRERRSANSVTSTLLDGQIRLLLYAPYADIFSIYDTVRKVISLVALGQEVGGVIVESTLNDAKELMLDLLAHYPNTDPNSQPGRSSSHDSMYVPRCVYKTEGLIAFWRECLDWNFVEYIQANLTDFAPYILANLLREILKPPRLSTLKYPLAVSILAALLPKVPANKGFKKVRVAYGQYAFQGWPESRGLRCDLSWNTRLQSCANANAYEEDHMAIDLADAWIGWCLFHEDRLCSGEVTELTGEEIDITLLLVAALQELNMFIGYRKRNSRDGGRPQIVIQMNATVRAFTAMAELCSEHPINIKRFEAKLSAVIGDVTPKHRALCTSAKTARQVSIKYGEKGYRRHVDPDPLAILDVDVLNAHSLTEFITQIGPDVLENAKLREELIYDVWTNQNGMLDAWQQLYMLACIRIRTDGNGRQTRRGFVPGVSASIGRRRASI